MAEKLYTTITINDQPFEEQQQQPVVARSVGFTDILEDLAMEQDEGSGKYPVS